MSLQNILDKNRLPALFIGSGLSKRYLENMPTWDELLIKIVSKIGINEIQYYAYKSEFGNDSLTLPKIAKLISDKIYEKVKNGEYDIKNDLSEELVKSIYEGTNFLKLLIANEFKDKKLKSDEITKREILSLTKMMEKINNIYTTNYDLLFEDFIIDNKDFKVFNKQSSLYLSESYGISEMYKIHGCVTNPDSIVIMEEDYEKYFENMNIFVSKLYSTLLERPVIFLGYSMSDDNIQKILQGFIKHFSNEEITKIKNNMIFIEWKEGEVDLKEGEALFQLEQNQIRMTKITTNRFDKVYDIISKIKEGITARQIKRFEEIIYDLIKMHEQKGEKVFLASPYNLETVDSNKLVLAIQPEFDRLPERGLVGVDAIKFIENALFDNKSISFDEIATTWVEKKLAVNHIFPIWYIENNLTSKINLGPKYNNNKTNMDSKYNKSKEISLNITDEKISEYLEKFYDQNKSPSKDLKSREFNNAKMLYLRNKISENEFRNYLKNHFKKNENYLKETSFKKGVCYLEKHKMELERTEEKLDE